MEVILIQDVNKLGKAGSVVKVKNGYARNLLFPNKMAYPATPSNLQRIEKQEKNKHLRYEKEKQEAQALEQKLNKVSLTISAEVNDLEKLYGTINESDVANALEAEGFTIDKKDILIDQPIKDLGIYEVGVNLHSEVTAKIRLWVTKK